MNANLREAIVNARQAILLDEEYNLVPKYRAKIYDILQKFNPKAYYYLTSLTLEYVLPLCEDMKVLNNLPQIVSDVIKDALEGKVLQTRLEDVLTSTRPLLEELGYEDFLNILYIPHPEETSQIKLETMVSFMRPLADELCNEDSEIGISRTSYAVFAAAFQALIAFYGVMPFEDVDVENAENEYDVDVWSSDTAQFAAYAYAGAKGFPENNPLKRQQFWQWWLDKAIPEACDLAAK